MEVSNFDNVVLTICIHFEYRIKRAATQVWVAKKLMHQTFETYAKSFVSSGYPCYLPHDFASKHSSILFMLKVLILIMRVLVLFLVILFVLWVSTT